MVQVDRKFGPNSPKARLQVKDKNSKKKMRSSADLFVPPKLRPNLIFHQLPRQPSPTLSNLTLESKLADSDFAIPDNLGLVSKGDHNVIYGVLSLHRGSPLHHRTYTMSHPVPRPVS